MKRCVGHTANNETKHCDHYKSKSVCLPRSDTVDDETYEYSLVSLVHHVDQYEKAVLISKERSRKCKRVHERSPSV